MMKGPKVIASLARYLSNVAGKDLHVLHRHGVAQLDRPLVVLSCAAPARGHALSLVVHRTERADGAGMILRRGLLDPWQRLRVVRIHTEAIVVHGAELPLAVSVTPLGSDLVRRHRSRLVDRHTLAPVVDAANEPDCLNVALVRGASAIAKVVRLPTLGRRANIATPLTWSIASCSITIAPSISPCCDADRCHGSGLDLPNVPIILLILAHTRNPSSYSFSGPGGRGDRHKGQVSDTPFARSSATHPVQNACPHGSVVGSRGGSRQMRHLSASCAFLQSRSCCAWAAAATT